MAGTLALTKAELSRLMHNRRYFIFTVAFPVILYLLIGRQVNAHAYGITFGAYYMISMATFGAFSGALNGNAQRIAQEKKEGWIRQLRLTPLPANAYVVTKVLVSLATPRGGSSVHRFTGVRYFNRMSRGSSGQGSRISKTKGVPRSRRVMTCETA